MRKLKGITLFMVLFLLSSQISFAQNISSGVATPIVCPEVLCVAPPDGCEYVDEVDSYGCPLCGHLVCKDPDPCPLLDCAAPPDGCEYARKSNDCLSCGKIVCGHDLNSCEESDGGINYYEKGVVEWSVQDFRVEDLCQDDTTLVEYYCKGDQYYREAYDCPNGCENGRCVEPEPCICPEIYDPVCSDGKTYSNECFARCEVEKWEDGACNVGCPDNWDPVCGLSHTASGVEEKNTYSNECELKRANAEWLYDGECEKETTCGNGICEEGEANDPGGCGPNAPPGCLGPPARQGTCPQDCEKPKRCATYVKGTDKDEVCATCGDGVCERGEECTSSSCTADGACTRDCGSLYCPQDCDQRDECSSDKDCPPINCFTEPCPKNKCIRGDCVLVEEHEPECKVDDDCPQITCITTPCPQLKCLRGECVQDSCGDGVCGKDEKGCFEVCYCPSSNDPVIVEEMTVAKLGLESASTVSGISSQGDCRCKEVCEFNCPQDCTPDAGCIDKCGDGTCQEVVCLGTNCPCGESARSCPRDCIRQVRDPEDLYERSIDEDDQEEAEKEYREASQRFNRAKEDLAEKKKRFLEAKHAGNTEDQAKHGKDSLLHITDMIISHLNKIKARLQENGHINEKRLDKIFSRLDNQIDRIQNVRSEAVEVDDVSQVRDVARNLRAEWDGTKKDAAINAQRVVSGKVGDVVNKGLIMEKRLNKALHESGNVNTAANKKVDEFSAHVKAAKKKQGVADELLDEAEEADAEKALALTDEVQNLLKEAKKDLARAHQSLKDVRSTSSTDIKVKDTAVEIER